MALNFVENDKLDQLLRKWALSDNIRYVNINQMSKQTGIGNNDIFDWAMKKALSGELESKWKVKCTRCGNMTKFENNEITEFNRCSHCHEKLHIDPTNLYPVFEITDAYKKYVNK